MSLADISHLCAQCVAEGIVTGAHKPGHQKRGTISLKHVYEIAKARQQFSDAMACDMQRDDPADSGASTPQVKKTDAGNEVVPLESICMSIVGTARSMGIVIVR